MFDDIRRLSTKWVHNYCDNDVILDLIKKEATDFGKLACLSKNGS